MPITAQLPIPLQDPMTNVKRSQFYGKGESKDPIEGHITDSWVRFFSSLTQTIATNPQTTRTLQLVNQAASISTTALPSSLLSLGLYRVCYYAKISRAAGTSSSLTVTLLWIDGGQNLTAVGTAITGNMLTTYQSGTLPLIHTDGATNVSYSTTYASVGSPSMLYNLALSLEQVG